VSRESQPRKRTRYSLGYCAMAGKTGGCDGQSSLRRALSLSFVTLALISVATAMVGSPLRSGDDVISNHWHVHLNGDYGRETAKLVAKRNGFSFVAPVSVSCNSFGFVKIFILLLSCYYPVIIS